VSQVDVRASSTSAPGLRLVLLAIVFLMALTADTRIASAAPSGAAQGVSPPSAAQSPFDRHGMWIWYVDRSEGGDVGRIVARAKRAGIGTLYIKAGDGGDVWSQFNKPLVRTLHQGGLSVCAWQFVYGDGPVDEAKVGATAVRRGADCLVIDAEGEDEGKYAAADLYIRALRARIGWGALDANIAGPVVGYRPVDSHPLLKLGSAGDLVVWAQAHLQAAVDPELPVTGIFGKQTRAAVRSFQASAGLPVDGAIETMTLRSLLNFDPVRPRWAGRRAKRGGGARASRALPPRRPLSASLPAKAYEIPPGPAP
jgi:Putative peptidoglycan binding domain